MIDTSQHCIVIPYTKYGKKDYHDYLIEEGLRLGVKVFPFHSKISIERNFKDNKFCGDDVFNEI